MARGQARSERRSANGTHHVSQLSRRIHSLRSLVSHSAADFATKRRQPNTCLGLRHANALTIVCDVLAAVAL